MRSPGGGAITAVGAARLGLSTALAAPLGEDDAGDFVRAALQRDGIVDRGAPQPAHADDRRDAGRRRPLDGHRRSRRARQRGRRRRARAAAVALSLDQLYCVPPGAAAYVTCGDDDARAFARRPPAKLAGARGLFVSQREALTLTEESDVEAAAEVLGRSAERVIVTLGGDGALALVDGRCMRVPAIETTALDTTGAGDLLVAAYIWGDLRGASPEECLALGGALRGSLDRHADRRRRCGHGGATARGRRAAGAHGASLGHCLTLACGGANVACRSAEAPVDVVARALVSRGREDLFSLAELDELAVKQEGDAVCDAARLREAVGHDHQREIRLESASCCSTSAVAAGVECGAWLVEEDRLGLGGEHPRDAQPLLLTARERERGLVEPSADLGEQPNPLEQLAHAPPALVFAGDESVLAKRQGDVVVDRHREGFGSWKTYPTRRLSS